MQVLGEITVHPRQLLRTLVRELDGPLREFDRTRRCPRLARQTGGPGAQGREVEPCDFPGALYLVPQ